MKGSSQVIPGQKQLLCCHRRSPIAIAHALGQLQGGRRRLVTLETVAGSWPHSWPDNYPVRVPCEQNPEAKINGSSGKQMTTSASNAEG